MKKGIHPDYVECTVRCSCGNTWTTRSTVSSLTVDLCDKCHPFYTGQQKLVDTGGRVQRFADKRFSTLCHLDLDFLCIYQIFCCHTKSTRSNLLGLAGEAEGSYVLNHSFSGARL